MIPYCLPQAFVDEVLELVELGTQRDALVGMPGVFGLSVEQRKVRFVFVKSHCLLHLRRGGLCLSLLSPCRAASSYNYNWSAMLVWT